MEEGSLIVAAIVIIAAIFMVAGAVAQIFGTALAPLLHALGH